MTPLRDAPRCRPATARRAPPRPVRRALSGAQRFVLHLWLAAAMLWSAAPARAISEVGTPTSDQVKAAYLHKFAGYVDWPPKSFAGPASPYVIGVIGADPVYDELLRLSTGHPVQGRAVEVRRMSRADAGAAVHMLFIGRRVGGDAAAVLAAYRGRPTLTVTEIAGGIDAGAVLNFVDSGLRVRFEASPRAAELGGLKLSSRLLAVAERVAGNPP